MNNSSLPFGVFFLVLAGCTGLDNLEKTSKENAQSSKVAISEPKENKNSKSSENKSLAIEETATSGNALNTLTDSPFVDNIEPELALETADLAIASVSSSPTGALVFDYDSVTGAELTSSEHRCDPGLSGMPGKTKLGDPDHAKNVFFCQLNTPEILETARGSLSVLKAFFL